MECSPISTKRNKNIHEMVGQGTVPIKFSLTKKKLTKCEYNVVVVLKINGSKYKGYPIWLVLPQKRTKWTIYTVCDLIKNIYSSGGLFPSISHSNTTLTV